MRCANSSATAGNLSVLYGARTRTRKKKAVGWAYCVLRLRRYLFEMPTASSWAKTYKLCYTFSQSPIDCLTEYDGKVSSLQSCGLLTLGTGMSLSLLSGSPTISLIRCILQNKCTAMPGASQYFDWMSVLCQLSSPPIPSSIFFQHTLSNFIFVFLPDAYIEGPWVPLFLPWLGLRDVLFPCYWCWQKQGTFFSHVLLISQTECTRCFLVAKDTWWHNHT